MSAANQACFADGATFVSGRVVENVPLAQATFRVRLECPEIAARIVPGQFIMLRLPGRNDPLLGRPLALYDTVLDAAGQPWAIDVVYLVMGRMTSLLAGVRPGDRLEAWGPLGNGFAPRDCERLLMVAGGIGQTPFLAVAREALGQKRYGAAPRPVARVNRVSLCYGARTKALLAGVDDFRTASVDVHLSTDDGSAGRAGLVTAAAEELLAAASQGTQVVCCGPEPMMAAVARLAAARDVPCRVSLETPMACGIGICFSCVARIRDDRGGWDYRRTCVEGPVFDAASLAW
jgi:dihydroorotate dehydrogenase electron transfer subunit